MNITTKKEQIFITLNKKFYDLSAVKESLEDFKEVCTSIIKNNENLEIILKPKDRELMNILGYEFCNYVLGLMKNKTLV